MRERVFISSVQKELSEERRALRDFVRGDPLLSQYFEVFLFEDLPASDGAPEQMYLAEVDRVRDLSWVDRERVRVGGRAGDFADRA